jgi:hypothetical protein
MTTAAPERPPAVEPIPSPRAVIEESGRGLRLIEVLISRIGDNWNEEYTAHLADVARRHATSIRLTFDRVWAAHGPDSGSSVELGEELCCIAVMYGRAVALLLADLEDPASSAVRDIVELWRQQHDELSARTLQPDGAA